MNNKQSAILYCIVMNGILLMLMAMLLELKSISIIKLAPYAILVISFVIWYCKKCNRKSFKKVK